QTGRRPESALDCHRLVTSGFLRFPIPLLPPCPRWGDKAGAVSRAVLALCHNPSSLGESSHEEEHSHRQRKAPMQNERTSSPAPPSRSPPCNFSGCPSSGLPDRTLGPSPKKLGRWVAAAKVHEPRIHRPLCGQRSSGHTSSPYSSST